MQIHTSNNRTTVNWAGGTSTEMFIYPPDGSFAERDFVFRISSATVEVEESTFTFFEGITRHLMILEGHLELMHVHRYEKILRPFDQDTFSGEWDTKSKGKVTDFNLMLKNGAEGKLEHHPVPSGAEPIFTSDNAFHFVYVADGVFRINGTTEVGKGDLVQLEKGDKAYIHAIESGNLVEITVALPATFRL